MQPCESDLSICYLATLRNGQTNHRDAWMDTNWATNKAGKPDKKLLLRQSNHAKKASARLSHTRALSEWRVSVPYPKKTPVVHAEARKGEP